MAVQERLVDHRNPHSLAGKPVGVQPNDPKRRTTTAVEALRRAEVGRQAISRGPTSSRVEGRTVERRQLIAQVERAQIRPAQVCHVAEH